MFLGNDYAGFAPMNVQRKFRTDGALTQYGPIVQNVGQSNIQGRINTITPQNGATTNFTTSGNSVLVYRSNTTANSTGFGSRVVFASFGLEGLGIDYYQKTENGDNYFFAHNLRPNILHNVVSYLRTGTFTAPSCRERQQPPVARRDRLSNPLPEHTLPGPRATLSATTGASGTYIIHGATPGTYQVAAYKTGFTRTLAPLQRQWAAVPVDGDTTDTDQPEHHPPAGDARHHHRHGEVRRRDCRPIGTPVSFVSTDGGRRSTARPGQQRRLQRHRRPGTYNGTATTTTPPATGTVYNITVPTNPDGRPGRPRRTSC